ncbi:MAG: hypothetical protein ACODAU_08045 [Myxococcota bacterium]
MHRTDPRIARAVVDGQELLFPSEEGWGEIARLGALEGRPIGAGRLLEQYRAVALATPGLRVALGEPPGQDKPWWIYHVVEVRGTLRRVRLERQTCHGCGWAGRTGNPLDYAIYIGTADPLAALRAHWHDERRPCPGCGAALKHPAVWIAEEDG